MNLHWKNLMEPDTGKVLLAAVAGIGGSAAVIDYLLKTVISLLTIWYLWKKIHPPKKTKLRDETEDSDAG